MMTIIAIILAVWFLSWRAKNVREAKEAARVAKSNRFTAWFESPENKSYWESPIA